MVVLAPHGEVTKTIPIVWLATYNHFESVDAVVGPKLIVTTIADKHIANMLPFFTNSALWAELV